MIVYAAVLHRIIACGTVAEEAAGDRRSYSYLASSMITKLLNFGAFCRALILKQSNRLDNSSLLQIRHASSNHRSMLEPIPSA